MNLVSFFRNPEVAQQLPAVAASLGSYTFEESHREDTPAENGLSEKIRKAANDYDNIKKTGVSKQHESSSYLNSRQGETNSRAKSIAEKLGFVNFEEDEFDSPSFYFGDRRSWILHGQDRVHYQLPTGSNLPGSGLQSSKAQEY